MPRPRLRSLLSTRRRISNVLMSRLVRLTSRCVAKLGVHAAEKDRSRPLRAGRQPHRHAVAQMNAVNVGLLHIGANPQAIRINERHDGLRRVHHFALERRPDIHDAVNGRADLGVSQNAPAPSASARPPPPVGGDSPATGFRRTAICSALERASATAARCASTCLRSVSTCALAAS